MEAALRAKAAAATAASRRVRIPFLFSRFEKLTFYCYVSCTVTFPLDNSSAFGSEGNNNRTILTFIILLTVFSKKQWIQTFKYPF